MSELRDGFERDVHDVSRFLEEADASVSPSSDRRRASDRTTRRGERHRNPPLRRPARADPSTIGFLETDAERAAAAFLEWRRRTKEPLSRLRSRRVPGRLEDVLLELLPLTDGEGNRFLFVATASAWTAYFDNWWRGADGGAEPTRSRP